MKRFLPLIAALGGFAVAASSLAQTPAEPTSVPTSSGPVATRPGPKPGELAPDFTVVGPDGKDIKLSDFRGKIVMLDIWATWCGPCVASMPHNSEMAEKFAKDGLVILSVCADDSRENYDGWVKRNSAKYKFLTAHDPAGKDGWKDSVFNTKYSVSGFPTIFLIDREGKLVGTTGGGGPTENPYVTRLLAKGGIPIDTSHLPPEDTSGPKVIAASAKTMATPAGKSMPMMGGSMAKPVGSDPLGSIKKFGSVEAGQPVPDFTVTGSDGQPLKFSSFKGKPALVAFWTGARMPAADVEQIASAYKDQGLAVLAVNIGTDKAEFDQWYAANKDKLGFQVAWDPAGKAAMESISYMQFGVGMFPAYFTAKADGKLAGGIIGMGGKVSSLLRAMVIGAGIKPTESDLDSVRTYVTAELAKSPAGMPAATIQPKPGGDAPAPADRVPTLQAGAVAPDFTSLTLDGKEVKLSDFKGKIVILDFWATWCGPCMASMPHTQEIAAKYKDQDVVVLAACTSDATAKFKEWVPKNQEKYPNLLFVTDPNERGSATFDDRASSKLYHVFGIPTQFIIGRDGKIAATLVGFGGKEDARAESALAKLGVKVDAAIAEAGEKQLKKDAEDEAAQVAKAKEAAKTPTPGFREAYGKLKAGDTLPDFTVLTPEGKEAKLSDYAKGKVVILDFWATWCGPCLAAMPHYQDVYAKYKDKNLVVIGLCSFDTREGYAKWVAANNGKIAFPTVFDPIGKPGDKEYGKTIMMQLGSVISPLPTTLVFSADGKFVGNYSGYGPGGEATLFNLLMIAGLDVATEDKPKIFFPAGSSVKAAAAGKPMAAGGGMAAATRVATLKAGDVAPDFTMHDVAGKEVKLSDFKDKVVILDFWATWCGPCIGSFPHTQEIAAKYKDQGVVVVASGTSDTIAKFQEWIPKNQPKYPDLQFYFDPNERGAATFEERASQKLYHVVGIPTQFVIGRDGKIAATIVGNGGKEDARTEGALALVGVKVDEATAAKGKEALAAAEAAAKEREAEAADELKNPKPYFKEAYGKLKAGEPVPDLVLQTADGQEAKFSELTKGKTVVFSTWSAGNGPSGEWLDFNEAWSKRYADQGVVFLGLGAYGSREDFDKWRAANAGKFTFPVVFDPAGKPPIPAKPMDEMNDEEKKAFQAASREHYGKIAPLKFTGGAMAPIPNNVVIDSQGRMVGFYVGAGAGSKDSLANLLLRAGIKLTADDMPRKVFTAAETKEAPPEARKEMLKVGAMAPDFVSQDLAGKDVKLSDLKGKVVILDFWATWCGPCMASMPHTQEVSAKYKDQGVVVLANCTSDARAKFESWVKSNHQQYPDILWTHDKAERTPERTSYKLYGVSGIPTQFIIDRDGKVADIVIGYMKGEAILDGALAKAGITVDPTLVEKAKLDLAKRASMSSNAPTPAPALKPAPAKS